MIPLTALTTEQGRLLRDLEEAEAALPRARARAQKFHDAGRLANPDLAASASLAYALCESRIVAARERLASLNDSEPAWRVEGDPVMIDARDELWCSFRGRRCRLEVSLGACRRPARPEDMRHLALVELTHDGRSHGISAVRSSSSIVERGR